MRLHVALPRVLPLTIVAMGGSLLLHGVHLVRGWQGPVDSELTIVAAARAEEVAKPAPLAKGAAAAEPAKGAPAAEPVKGTSAAEAVKGTSAAEPVKGTSAAEPAKGASSAEPGKAGAPDAARPTEGAAVAVPQAGAPPVNESERALLQDLRARRGEIDNKAATLAEREAILAAAEKRLDARLNELTALQKRLEQLDGARKQREEANWQSMVKVYETMKPHDAATIFNDLDMPVLLQVIDRMKAAKAASVLGAMQPERARQVTAQLAQLRTSRESLPGG